MRSSFTKAFALGVLLCSACGSTSTNPFTISGHVYLADLPDGGSEVLVDAMPARLLPDGGTVPAYDAGVALNGVPLGRDDYADATFIGGGEPTTLYWTRPSIAGAAHGLTQTLSVIGSIPEATATFSCPARVFFTEPSEGATLDRAAPVHIAWAAEGGASAFATVFGFGVELLDAQPQPLLLGGIALGPSITSYDFSFPTELVQPGPARVTFSVTVPANSSSPDSLRASLPSRSVLFP